MRKKFAGDAESGVILRAFRDTLPVMTGYVVLGIGFGILLSSKGYGAIWALLMGLMIYSGTMQFVAIDLIAGSATLASAAITALMVGARHLFYGISMLKRYEKSGFMKPYLIYALTDETYSLVCNSECNSDGDLKYCFFVSLLDQVYWVTGSVIGAILGAVLEFDARGIDFALTALFITICTEQWLNESNHVSALTGFAASVLCLIIFGSENFLIPSMILITIALFALKGKISHE